MYEKKQFWAVFAASIAFSVGGFLFGVFVPHHACDAGRGGALGTATALGFLFINRDYGAKLYKTLTRDLPELKARIEQIKRGKSSPTLEPPVPPNLPSLEKRLDVLIHSIAIEGKGHLTEAKFLGFATFVGTIIWGFGDIFAKWLT